MNIKCTLGLPRSGKSTFCKNWVLEKPGRVIVNADSIRLAITGYRFNSLAEPFVEAVKLTMIRTLMLDFEIIVDETHTTINSIRKILQIDKNTEFIVFDTHPQTCKERAKTTNQEDLYPVIDRMYDQFMQLREMDAPRYDIQETINKIRETIVENRIQTQ